MIIHAIKRDITVTRINTDEYLWTIVPFGSYDTLPNEYVLIEENAFGGRSTKIVSKEDLIEKFGEAKINLI